jgi:hypothetical protein
MGVLGKWRGRKALLPAGVVALLAAIIGWVLSHLGGGGLGAGGTAGSSQDAPAHTAAAQSGGTMEVQIREDGYFVDGSEMTPDQIVAAAGSSAVKVVSGPDSRMGALRDLEKVLDTAHISWALEAQPVSGP